jgi:hypothetical protein
MSATLSPAPTVEAPLETAAPSLRLVAVPPPIRLAPEVRSSDVTRPSVTTHDGLRDALFTATWIPALAVASAVAAVGLAIAQPIVLARELYGERRYR